MRVARLALAALLGFAIACGTSADEEPLDERNLCQRQADCILACGDVHISSMCAQSCFEPSPCDEGDESCSETFTEAGDWAQGVWEQCVASDDNSMCDDYQETCAELDDPTPSS